MHTTYVHSVCVPLDDVIISPSNLKFTTGLSKIEPNYERVKSEAGHMDNHVHIISQVEDHLKEAHGSHGEQGIKKAMIAHEPNIGKDLKTQPLSHGLQAKNYVEEKIAAHRTKNEENLKEISVSYGSKVGEAHEEVSGSYGLESENNLKEICFVILLFI